MFQGSQNQTFQGSRGQTFQGSLEQTFQGSWKQKFHPFYVVYLSHYSMGHAFTFS